ncbi:zinc-binding dehydrogenase [Solibacillus sp. FSL H8-0523]|uniref:zinc-dependent alcohol dehydrogenase n=1 Tax=Solibacillus sp. FSL H8-0523 TaxID=2954511 RepID=UPI00310160B8
MTNYQAGIYKGANLVAVEERPVPEVGPNDVLLRNLRGGICGTDINIVKYGSEMGIRFEQEFGHELAGIIEAKGDNVTDLEVGMFVAVNPITAKRAGRRFCLEVGGFSQYVLIEDAKKNHNLYPLNDDVTPEEGALVEPMSVGCHGAFSVKPQVGENIVILGAGPIGLSAAAMLIGEGITNVAVVDMVDWRLEKAKEIGAKTVDTSKVSLTEGLAEAFGTVNVYGKDVPNVDAYVDAAGAAPLFQQVMQIVKPNARIAIIAVYKDEVPVSFMEVMSKEVQIVGASGYTSEDILKVINHLNNKKTKIATMVTQVYPLSEIQTAFDTAIAAKDSIKVIVDVTK